MAMRPSPAKHLPFRNNKATSDAVQENLDKTAEFCKPHPRKLGPDSGRPSGPDLEWVWKSSERWSQACAWAKYDLSEIRVLWQPPYLPQRS